MAASSGTTGWRATAGAVAGNALEWFDFAVFGLLAAAFSRLFFPTDDPTSSLLLAFATFAIPFVARPVGGVVFGIWADRLGRRSALAAVFGLMALGTLAIGLLPTHAAIGVAAPVALVLSRMVQGFSAGGEFAGATAALIEFAPKERRGFRGSLQMLSQVLAILLASVCVFALGKSLSPADFDSWGWRLPFLAGALVGPLGLWMRLRMAESPEFEEEARRKALSASPLRETVASDRRALAAGILVFAAVVGPSYVNTVYLPGAAVREHGIAQPDAVLTVMASALLMALLVPLAGLVSDRVPRATLAAWAAAATAAAYGVLYARYAAAPSASTLMTLQVGYVVPYAFVVGTAPTLVMELFPVRRRATGGSIAYNAAAMAFGGLAPMVVAAGTLATGSHMVPAAYVCAVTALGAIGAVLAGRKAA